MPSRGFGRIDDDAVELVDAAVVQRRVDLVVLHPRFGLEERRRASGSTRRPAAAGNRRGR